MIHRCIVRVGSSPRPLLLPLVIISCRLLFSLSFRWITVGDTVVAQVLIRQQDGSRHSDVSAVWDVILCNPVFLFHLDSILSSCSLMWCVWLPLLAAQCLDRDSTAPYFDCLFCLCCGCPPSCLSSILALFGWPIGHPGDR